MVLTDPRLLIAQPIEPFDQLEVTADGERRVVVSGVERRQKDAAAQHEIAHELAPFRRPTVRAFLSFCPRKPAATTRAAAHGLPAQRGGATATFCSSRNSVTAARAMAGVIR